MEQLNTGLTAIKYHHFFRCLIYERHEWVCIMLSLPKAIKKNLFISHELFLVADDKSNRFLQNDGTSQKLSRDEIMNLKAQGVSGKVSLV